MEQTEEWKGLYMTAGVSALLMALFIPIQIAVFILVPPPSTPAAWFDLFNAHPLLGLIDMDIMLVVDTFFMVIIFLAFYELLKKYSRSAMLLAVVFGLVGATAYLSSVKAFEMLSLSSQYAGATTDIQRAAFIAAGQVMVSTWQGTAFDVGYILEGIALLIISLVLLRSNVFGKTVSYLAIMLGALSLVPPTVGTLGMACALISLIPLELLDILIAWKFFLLARRDATVPAN